jgi:hypothetical protein
MGLRLRSFASVVWRGSPATHKEGGTTASVMRSRGAVRSHSCPAPPLAKAFEIGAGDEGETDA